MTEGDRKLATKLAAQASGRSLVVVGCDGGLGSGRLALIIAEAQKQGAAVVLLEDAPPPKKDFVLTLPESELLPEKLMMPVLLKPEREWWRGGNPKRNRRRA